MLVYYNDDHHHHDDYDDYDDDDDDDVDETNAQVFVFFPGFETPTFFSSHIVGGPW